MRLWQKRSRLCHFLELRSGMRIDSLGCTWWVLSSKWSKSSQLAVATEPLVPLIRLGLYVLGRCSTWGCLFSRRRIFSVALPPQDAPRHRRRPTTASRHQRRTYTRFAPSAADLVRRFLSAADLVAQTEQHGQRPLAATTSTARGHELAGADSHMACAPTPMGGEVVIGKAGCCGASLRSAPHHHAFTQCPLEPPSSTPDILGTPPYTPS